MSEDCCYSENCCSGFGELANPLQWPQLRKRRRLVALRTPSQLRLGRLPTSCRTGASPVLLPLRIRSARERPWRRWFVRLTHSLNPLLILLLPKVYMNIFAFNLDFGWRLCLFSVWLLRKPGARNGQLNCVVCCPFSFFWFPRQLMKLSSIKRFSFTSQVEAFAFSGFT